jgi:hypothetical protein
MTRSLSGRIAASRGHTHADITIAPSPILDLAEKLKATMGAPPNE